MALPKIKSVEYSKILPVSKEEIILRPFTVGDEKIILTANMMKESNPKQYAKNILDVVQGCIVSSHKFASLKFVDAQYVMMQLKAISSGEIIEVTLSDENNKNGVEVTIDINKMDLIIDPDHHYDIKLTDTMGIRMKDLQFDAYLAYSAKEQTGANKAGLVYDLIVDSVESIYDGEEMYIVGTHTTVAEVRQFIEELSGKGVSEKLYQFASTMPSLGVTITMPDGTERVVKNTDFLD